MTQEQGLLSAPFPCLVSLPPLLHPMSILASLFLCHFFFTKKDGFEKPKVQKSEKKKEEMLWRRAHVHKEKNNDYFLFINSRDQTKFPCIFHENTIGNHNKSILDPQLQNYRTTLIAKQVIYVSRG